MTFEQIKKLLNRLVEVIKVIDFTDVFVRMKEILYVKVRKMHAGRQGRVLPDSRDLQGKGD